MGRSRLRPDRRSVSLAGRLILFLVLLLLLVPVSGGVASRAAATRAPLAAPDWMSAETAAALDLGFDVMVPGWLPAPFGGAPSVYASGGYYSLYWVVYGGAPTFLEITGEVGGAIPAGSAYDLNVQLVVNADVQGSPAYRDLTPIYDTVWWQVGSVVYSVSSQNMSGADSLSLANALTRHVPTTGGGDTGGGGEPSGGGEAPAPALDPAVYPPSSVGSGESVTVWVEGDGVRLETDGGSFAATGGATYPGAGNLGVTWQAPRVEGEQIVTFVLIDEATGEQVALAETVVLGAGGDGAGEPEAQSAGEAIGEPADEGESGEAAPVEPDEDAPAAAPVGIALTCPPVVYSGRLAPVRLRGTGDVVISASHGGWPDEPGNRQLDEAASGGPDLAGESPGEDHFYLHWRAPLVRSVLQVTLSALGPDGEQVAACSTSVRPGPPPNSGDVSTDGDGSGGPRPHGPGPTGVGGMTDAGSDGDGSEGPTGLSPDDGTAGPPEG